MDVVQIKDKQFGLTISEQEIQKAIQNIATRMNKDLKDKNPLFICVLNGAFMFAAELMKRLTIPLEVTFVKLSSYEGLMSTGKIKEVFGLTENISDRTIVVVEDIIDTGTTMANLIESLGSKNVAEVYVATLLLKPDALVNKVPLDYVAIEIPNDFIVGYGLDYDGYGRNLAAIYTLIP
ncbi:MAG: hypoxanthine phosphoribosyltransferase [Paludibacteraceae bacterium]|nr:hypoxanthine phosphoribosyltransferase [Paludibacteraceae bacterium]MBP6283876.1 hypoxanthine phosphoribosyltransferase [Paludibacteraceae bacterium]